MKIPDKLYFKIGEVSDLTGVKPYVLRYWESEFNIVKPSKTASNQRLYKRREVELILEIKRLLYEEKFTIAGAKKVLNERGGTTRRSAGQMKLPLQQKKTRELLQKMRKEIEAIKKLVETQ
ncbi:MAG: MerR family transcriptional regulator [Deltaproteobacteria bacterium]|nr:MerR family transcriptional regulator [bacterium]MCB9475473.1 MerR family transcriptional regulator [Deltaproteobacteria bacterium]MCB9488524.1 MerR family transcriptional regulator [Deltaproteobacteria bacterium]